jgi:hypothetical protein
MRWRSAAIGRHSTVGSHGGADMRLIPSMLKASDAELAAFRAKLQSRLMVPADTPPEEVDLAFEEIADKIIAYLSFPGSECPRPAVQGGTLQVMRSGGLQCNGGTVGSAADLDRWQGVHHWWFLLRAPHRLACHRRLCPSNDRKVAIFKIDRLGRQDLICVAAFTRIVGMF